MRALLIAAIRLYWFVVPARRRRACLFRESCSHHVFRITASAGFAAGMTALRRRYRQCRPGYGFYTRPDHAQMIVLADGSVLEPDEARPGLAGRQD